MYGLRSAHCCMRAGGVGGGDPDLKVGRSVDLTMSACHGMRNTDRVSLISHLYVAP